MELHHSTKSELTNLFLDKDLLSVVLVFWITNYFLPDEWGIIHNIEELISKLNQQDHPSSLSFFQTSTEIIDRLQSAKAIDLCGISLRDLVGNYYSVLQKSISQGKDIRYLIIDPESSAVDMAMLRSQSKDAESYRRDVNEVLDSLRDINFQSINSEKRSTKKGGKISVRLLSYCPSHCIYAFDTKKEDGVIYIEIYPHKSRKKGPTFELMLSKDGEWYEYFRDQFETMWSNAREWTPTPKNQ